MKKYIIKISALIMSLALILCPLSVCFATDEPVPTPIPLEVGQDLWSDSAVSLIWALLQAWDIDISRDDVDYYTDEIGEEITNLVLMYLDTLPSVGSIISWTQMWSWGSDFWGNMRMNSSMLEDIEDFANWLLEYFDLDNNDSAVIGNNYSIGGYQLYNTDTYYRFVDLDGNYYGRYYSLSYNPSGGDSNIVGYFVYFNPTTSKYRFFYVSLNKPTSTVDFVIKYTDYEGQTGNFAGGYMPTSAWTDVANGYSRSSYTDCFPNADYHPEGDYLSSNGISNWLSDKPLTYDGRSLINTGDVLLPSDDPSYTPGDGVTIVDDKPEYAQVQVVNPITISNLPAIVSTGSIPNPGFSDVFLPLRAFVTTFSDGMAVVKDIIFHLPTEALAIFYAIMSITVIFGALHMFKEH